MTPEAIQFALHSFQPSFFDQKPVVFTRSLGKVPQDVWVALGRE